MDLTIAFSKEFDQKEVSGNYEKLKYNVSHTFGPEVITICTITPKTLFRSDQNGNVTKVNNKIGFTTRLIDPQ